MSEKLNNAINILKLSGNQAWISLRIYKWKSSQLENLIDKISNHGFHTDANPLCMYCKTFNKDQAGNRDFLMKHLRGELKNAIAETLNFEERIAFALETGIDTIALVEVSFFFILLFFTYYVLQ